MGTHGVEFTLGHTWQNTQGNGGKSTEHATHETRNARRESKPHSEGTGNVFLFITVRFLF